MARRYQVVILGGGFPVPVGDDAHTFPARPTGGP